MPLDAHEAALERDLVTLVNRTKEPLFYRFDGVIYTLAPYGEKGYRLAVPRYVAVEYAIPQNKIEEDFSTGKTLKSFLGIEEDENYPTDPLVDVDVKAVQEAPKHEFEPTTVIDPETGKVHVVTPKAKHSPTRREDFSANNE